ncbi:MAG: GAF domain-containing protein [Calditrichaeota bacterium]|nr:MAG: GAF domain-containing protein [Calditrichota bacterium]
MKQRKYSTDDQINTLLNRVVEEVKEFAEAQFQRIQSLTRIGIALSAEKDINRLLELIVDEAMKFSNADAGTLYTLDEEAKCLRFEILKNLTLKTHMGGTSGIEVTLPPVPLEINGEKNFSNVSSYVALTGKIVNIPDVYEAEGFDFTGPKKYDAQTGYRSRSMLVVPMMDHNNEIIGVLQLLNSRSPENGEIVAFSREYEQLIISLASQAAVALENAQLIQSLKDLFEAFIKSIATAIDEKSPYTGGHIRRVTELTMDLARAVNETREGPLAQARFTEDELEELRIAAWMHDVGKITTPEYVVDKSRKLETIFDRIELVKTRFELAKQQIRLKMLESQLYQQQPGEASTSNQKQLEAEIQRRCKELDDDFAFLEKCNKAEEYLEDSALQRLKEIAAKQVEINGHMVPLLTEEELKNLSIRKGTLTEEERKIIENHALMSYKILQQLPFPKKLSHVPEYAGGHHEKLDGTGYPFGLTAEKLPLQARIMALADVFEALTAKDRPYKDPMKLSTAIQILEKMTHANHIDPDLYELFIKKGLHLKYAQKELYPEQIDLD